MQKAFAVLAGPVLVVWLFLMVATPVITVVLMLAAITWLRSAAPENTGFP